MILSLDIGNTSITCALFDNENIVEVFSVPSDTNLTVLDYGKLFALHLKRGDFDGAIISSVVEELNKKIQESLLSDFGVLSNFLTYESNMPIKLALKNNKEIGADRIANGVRAYNLYKKAVIVVDFGTATTFDIVNSKGEFIGGIIAPGINTQLKSLNSSTSKLPQIDIKTFQNHIGRNTEEAILSGVISGTASMVDGMVEKCEKELGENAVIIVTGGLGEFISKYMKRKPESVNPFLTLEGLRDLYYYNKSNIYV